MTDKLLPCPFCGEEAKLVRFRIGSGSNTTGHLGPGCELVKIDKGKKIQHNKTKEDEVLDVYFWDAYRYTVECESTNCFCRNDRHTRFVSEEEAIRSWNSRKLIKEF